MGATSRRKGRLGQSIFANMLRERDWIVADLSCGIKSEDILATDPLGRTWAVEVKRTSSITAGHVQQARQQAEKRKARWMLANHIEGTSSWLVRRQGERPIIWHEGEKE